MELFLQAVTIMVLGMGLVFVFLALVILLVHAAAKWVRWHEAKSSADEQAAPKGVDGEQAAVVIAVALHEQR